MAVTENELPATSVPECCVVKVKSFIAPGPTVMVLDVPDCPSAVALMVAVSVLTNLKPVMPAEMPRVKVWLQSAAKVALEPLGELVPPEAQDQDTEWPSI